MPLNYLSVENLSKSYDEKLLFEDVTFGIEQGQKVALVGINGSGKSTLLKVISGIEQPDRGVVSFRKEIKVEMLQQVTDLSDTATIEAAIFDGSNELLQLIRNYEVAIATGSEDLQTLLEEMDRLNAWEYEHEVKELLGKLGIYHLDQLVGDLSGGQKKRVALAKTLVLKPDLLILDEPTNHLDLDIIEWLENYLAITNLTLLMVTHDRYFLDRVTNEIVEIAEGQLFKYKGNYSDFLEKKQERAEIEEATVSKAKNLLKKELEWMRRQPKARGTKAKYRIDAFYDLEKKASKKVTEDQMEVNLSGQRQGKKIMELKGISKGYDGKTLIKDLEYVFKKGDRMGIVGNNGSGKSTLLKMIIGELQPDGGTVTAGQNTVIGYYSQEEQIFDPSQKVIDTIKEVAEYITLADGSEVTASNLLNQFLFPPKKQYALIGKLSGGERRRLQLLRMLMSNPNFIILDEPTNDFDIQTLNVLEDYLLKFDGCLLIVSHDRYFMDRLVDHLFVFQGDGEVRDFPGNYSDYRNSPLSKQAVKSEEKVEEVKVKTTNRKLSYGEKREYESLGEEIATLEEEKAELEESLNSGETDFEKLGQWSARIEKITELLDEKELRWLELDELQ